MPVSEEIFNSDTSCIQKLIQKLDLLDDEANAAVREGMKEGARIINEEQKRLSRNLHDTVAQDLAAVKAYLQKGDKERALPYLKFASDNGGDTKYKKLADGLLAKIS